MQKVLVLNGSFCEIPIIEECHRMGYYVITAGNMPDLEGHKMADEYINCDYSDYKAVLRIVKDNNIVGVLSCANDFGSITAAYVDEQMGWNHHDTFQNSLLEHHKDLFKSYMMSKGYPVPNSVAFEDEVEAMRFVENCADYPIIVKANDLTGGKGILRADNEEQAIAAVQNAFSLSRSKHIIIEKFISGDQQTFVTFLHDRKVVSYTGCDSFSYVNPYLVQSEVLPSEDIDQISDKLISIVETMAQDLHLADGIFAFQYVKNGHDVCIFEMMRRPFGNQFLKLVEHNTDFPWHLAQVVAEIGGDWSSVKRKPIDHKYCGHFEVMASRNGTLTDYSIPDDILAHVIKRFDMKKVGDRIVDFKNERITFLHLKYDDAAEMRRDIRTYFDRIKVVVR